MNHTAREHIAEVEAKQRAERMAQQNNEERESRISQLRNSIASAERRKAGPFFTSQEAEETYFRMKENLERQADNYVKQQNTACQTARPTNMALCSEGAMAFFFMPLLLMRLPELAERMTRRDGRFAQATDDQKAKIVAQCDAEIQDKQRLLELLLN